MAEGNLSLIVIYCASLIVIPYFIIHYSLFNIRYYLRNYNTELNRGIHRDTQRKCRRHGILVENKTETKPESQSDDILVDL
jgi:hypothetical protein